MFRAELEKKFRSIFGIDKVTFNEEGSFEQDTLFVEVNNCRTNPSQGFLTARVQGSIFIFAQRDKIPFGFFAKRITQADNELTKDLFFFEMDTENVASPARIQNISERRCRFEFFFKTQYDVPKGDGLGGVDFSQISLIEDGSGNPVDMSGDGEAIGVDTE